MVVFSGRVLGGDCGASSFFDKEALGGGALSPLRGGGALEGGDSGAVEFWRGRLPELERVAVFLRVVFRR